MSHRSNAVRTLSQLWKNFSNHLIEIISKIYSTMYNYIQHMYEDSGHNAICVVYSIFGYFQTRFVYQFYWIVLFLFCFVILLLYNMSLSFTLQVFLFHAKLSFNKHLRISLNQYLCPYTWRQGPNFPFWLLAVTPIALSSITDLDGRIISCSCRFFKNIYYH